MVETPALLAPPRIRQVASWILRLAVAGSCLGLARIMIETYSPVNSLLYIEWQLLSEGAANAIDTYGGWLLVGLAALALCWPHPAITTAIAFYFFVFAVATTLIGSGMSWRPTGWNRLEVVAIAAHATRYVAPLALGALWWTNRRRVQTRGRGVEWLLRIAAAATFAAHGLEAIWQHPTFKDYLIVAADSFLSADLPERIAGYMLYVIGAIDLLVAALILGVRWRWVAGYMAAWGVITAGARIIHGGFDAWQEFAIRLANSAVPLSLLILWWPAPSIAQSVQPAQDTSPRVQT